MKNYPIKNENYLSDFGMYSNSATIPVFDWGKKIYVLIEDELRAIIPLFVAVAKLKDKQDKLFPVLGCKMAGKDKNQLIHLGLHYHEGFESVYSGPKFFKTQEDYIASINKVNNVMKFKHVSLNSMFAEKGMTTKYWFEAKTGVMMWGFDSSCLKPLLRYVGVKALWIDDEGTHVELTMMCAHNLSEKLYATPEEAIAANTAKVVDFSDEDESPKDKEWWVDLPSKVSVTAKTEDEAKEKVRDALNEIVK